MAKYKTLEEYFLAKFEQQEQEITELKNALDGAQYTITSMQKNIDAIKDILHPEVRSSYDGTDTIIEFKNVWKNIDGEELFNIALAMFGLEDVEVINEE